MTPPRRAARTERVLAPGWFGYLLNGSLAAGAVVLALVRDVPVPLVAVTLAPAVLVGLGAGLVPRFGMPLLVVAFIVSTGVTGELGLDRGVALVPPAGLFLGFTLALSVRYRRQQTVRSPAPGPPGPGRVHARWEDDEEDVAVDDADAETALDAVRRLDGRTRTVVTLHRPPARLDVAGDAAGAMTTYHCADTTARRPRWRHLGTTSRPDGEVMVRIAQTDGHLRRHQTTTLDPAIGAVTAFLADGSADPALPWSDDDPDGELRPPALQVTDRDR
ncbi:hypothetical protein [Nocardioides sp. AX2bis]|uniref:hypothetical protein n=1 Tax=Nocardioides sp. AX2bis TaxID=2653157 RepID=UPI0012F23B5D|nr:hypothetical protein [Nocardioides sp. AX2bis]VXC55546.1 conserved membrane hypothetical protein [Nocardioides sp. AX2bis]